MRGEWRKFTNFENAARVPLIIKDRETSDPSLNSNAKPHGDRLHGFSSGLGLRLWWSWLTSRRRLPSSQVQLSNPHPHPRSHPHPHAAAMGWQGSECRRMRPLTGAPWSPSSPQRALLAKQRPSPRCKPQLNPKPTRSLSLSLALIPIASLTRSSDLNHSTRGW